MTLELVIKDMLLLVAVFGCGYAVYREKEIAAFEHRAARAVRCFFQAIVMELRRSAVAEKQPVAAVEPANDPYLVLLAEVEETGSAARIA